MFGLFRCFPSPHVELERKGNAHGRKSSTPCTKRIATWHLAVGRRGAIHSSVKGRGWRPTSRPHGARVPPCGPASASLFTFQHYLTWGPTWQRVAKPASPDWGGRPLRRPRWQRADRVCYGWMRVHRPATPPSAHTLMCAGLQSLSLNASADDHLSRLLSVNITYMCRCAFSTNLTSFVSQFKMLLDLF